MRWGSFPAKFLSDDYFSGKLRSGKFFRMDRTRKILISRRNLLKQNSLESHSTLLLLSKSLRENNIFRVFPIRKIFWISISRKTKPLTKILPGMNPILFPIVHSVAYFRAFISSRTADKAERLKKE